MWFTWEQLNNPGRKDLTFTNLHLKIGNTPIKVAIEIYLLLVQMIQPRCNDIGRVCKNSRLVLSGRSNFYMVDNLSIAVHALSRRMLTSFSVGKTLLPRNMNCSINFRCVEKVIISYSAVNLLGMFWDN